MKKKMLLVLPLLLIAIASSSNSYANEVSLQVSESANILHTHGDSCVERRWIACGGQWCTNFEPSVGATVYYCSNNQSSKVVNGVRLSSIHSGWTTSKKSGTHSGEYRNVTICSSSTSVPIGTVTLNVYDNGLAGVHTTEDYLSIESVTWSSGQVGNNVTLEGVGDYTVSIQVRDSRYDTVDTVSIDFTFSDGVSPSVTSATYGTERSAQVVVEIQAEDNVGVSEYMITNQ